jgi:hypothetical protein
MDASTYAALQSAFVRMVVPLRREFGVALDVPRMRHDIDYAQFAVTLALHSDSPTLHHCAELVDTYIHAARARDHGIAEASSSRRESGSAGSPAGL